MIPYTEFFVLQMCLSSFSVALRTGKTVKISLPGFIFLFVSHGFLKGWWQEVPSDLGFATDLSSLPSRMSCSGSEICFWSSEFSLNYISSSILTVNIAWVHWKGDFSPEVILAYRLCGFGDLLFLWGGEVSLGYFCE